MQLRVSSTDGLVRVAMRPREKGYAAAEEAEWTREEPICLVVRRKRNQRIIQDLTLRTFERRQRNSISFVQTHVGHRNAAVTFSIGHPATDPHPCHRRRVFDRAR